jgi:hypothetical protein
MTIADSTPSVEEGLSLRICTICGEELSPQVEQSLVNWVRTQVATVATSTVVVAVGSESYLIDYRRTGRAEAQLFIASCAKLEEVLAAWRAAAASTPKPKLN